ncbi:MAG: hypothetical protein LBM18_00855 [Oscillospiraceae bacterium]|jgi:hypothetical protein|nr:hypothetical protein [Oscillospiraceae bacterium]
MNEWTIVTALVTLVGLGAAIVKPLISLNSVITRLTELMGALEADLSELTQRNGEAHLRIWDKLEEHGGELNTHELRLALIERPR